MAFLAQYWTLFSLVATIFLSLTWTALPSLWWLLPISLLLLLRWYCRCLQYVVGILIACGVILVQDHLLSWQADTVFDSGRKITITAEVTSFFDAMPYGYRGTVNIQAINGKALHYFQRPNVQLIAPQPLMLGDKLQAQVTLKSMAGLRNEVGFDREQQAMSQRLVARATIVKNTSWLTISSYHLRSQLFTYIQQQFEEGAERALTLALAFGYRGEIEPELWQALRNSGLAHLVAISGLHIGLSFSIGFMLGTAMLRLSHRMVWLPWVMGSLAAVGYAWLAGFSITTERALVMCVLNMLLSLLHLRISVVGRILLTLAVLLVWDPVAPLSISFWLSFIAVSAVLTYFARQETKGHWLLQLLKMQVWLDICMIPASLWFFEGMTPVSSLYNLIFIPWFSFLIVPPILVGLLLAVLFPNYDGWSWLWMWVDGALSPAIEAITWADEVWWSLNAIWLQRALLLFGYALIWTLLSRKGRIWLLVFGIALSWGDERRQHRQDWRLDVLDIGHGLAIMIEKDRRAMLYDVGDIWENGSVAESVILPLLRQRNIESLDGIVLSHLDSDHAGGLSAILAEWQPKWVRASQTTPPFTLCVAGQNWQWNQLEFEVVWPMQGVQRAYNLNSCVVRLHDPVSDIRILLTGDIEALVEWILIRQPEQLKSDVIIVPHHGSKTSSIQPLTQVVGARYAMASMAFDNRWHLPSPQVVARYQSAGSIWLDTAHQGQISVRVENGRWWVESLRQNDAWYRHLLRKRVE